jgi:hypothetical protein
MSPNDLPNQLFTVALAVLPDVLAIIKARRAAADPNAPTPTDLEVLEGLRAAVTDSLAKDDAWLAAHPRQPAPPIGGG